MLLLRPMHTTIVMPGGLGAESWGIPDSYLLGIFLQYNLAKDAVQALRAVHGIDYLYGSISTTLCE